MSYLALARQAAARSLSTARTSGAAGAHPPLADLLSMPLAEFARADWVLEVRVPWWPETLFSPEDLRVIMIARRDFAGEVVQAQSRRD